MKKHWQLDELIDHFTLIEPEKQLVESKYSNTQLGFAVLMKCFQHEARFPAKPSDVPKAVINFISKQLKIPSDMFVQYSWSSRTIKNHRNEIRKLYGFREGTLQDEKDITHRLQEKVWDYAGEFEPLKETVYAEYRRRKIEPPTDNQIERMVKSALWHQEQQFYQDTYQKLSPTSISRMDALMESWMERGKTPVDYIEIGSMSTFLAMLVSPFKKIVYMVECSCSRHSTMCRVLFTFFRHNQLDLMSNSAPSFPNRRFNFNRS
jgi:hypothetical protein